MSLSCSAVPILINCYLPLQTLVISWEWATFSAQSLHMIWEKMNHHAPLLQEYRIGDIERKLILKFNPLHRSARLTIDQLHRLLFLEGITSISGKTVIKNEYGLEVGSLSYSKSDRKNEGSLKLDGNKFGFTLTNDNAINIYNKENGAKLSHAEARSFPINASLTTTDICCIVISLCWQLCLPQIAQPTKAYAHA